MIVFLPFVTQSALLCPRQRDEVYIGVRLFVCSASECKGTVFFLSSRTTGDGVSRGWSRCTRHERLITHRFSLGVFPIYLNTHEYISLVRSRLRLSHRQATKKVTYFCSTIYFNINFYTTTFQHARLYTQQTSRVRALPFLPQYMCNYASPFDIFTLTTYEEAQSFYSNKFE